MNEIPLSVIRSKLSSWALSEIDQLLEFLDFKVADSGRYASSLVARSELELIGASVPRFVWRLPIIGHKGFIQIRRLDLLRLSFLERINEFNDDTGIYDSVFDRLSPIADCLLPKPIDCASYRILSQPLGFAYGEEGSRNQDFSGTPYVKSIDIGGGLCVQAVCYMATMVLYRYASTVHGLAEITALAHQSRQLRFSVAGLRFPGMRRYFNSVGLTVSEQLPAIPADEQVRRPTEQLELSDFELAIQSYIRSGFPIAFHTDVGRLSGFHIDATVDNFFQVRSIYEANGMDRKQVEDSKNRFAEPMPHCVMIVGVSELPRDDGFDYIIHDPGTLPFLRASARLLSDAGSYQGQNMDLVNHRRICPIVPRKVQMPILWEHHTGSDTYTGGVLLLGKIARSDPSIRSKVMVPDKARPDALRLTSIDQVMLSLRSISYTVSSTFGDLVREMVDRLLHDFEWVATHFIWIEVFGSAIWIWDAEASSNADSFQEVLVAICSKEDSKIIWI